MRSVWSKVLQDPPGKVERSELTLCVAPIGMQRAGRESAKNFSSPEGSFSPTGANAWYSSHMKRTCRQVRPGSRSIRGIRLSTAR